jgi:hypothetical protein
MIVDRRNRLGSIQQEAIKNGMITLWQDGLKKVEDGTTSLSELERVTDDTSDQDVKITDAKEQSTVPKQPEE